MSTTVTYGGGRVPLLSSGGFSGGAPAISQGGWGQFGGLQSWMGGDFAQGYAQAQGRGQPGPQGQPQSPQGPAQPQAPRLFSTQQQRDNTANTAFGRGGSAFGPALSGQPQPTPGPPGNASSGVSNGFFAQSLGDTPAMGKPGVGVDIFGNPIRF